jgi:NRPS condensation-like uncharacterized protein
MNPRPSPDRIPASPMDQFNYALQGLGESTMHFAIVFDGVLDTGRLEQACAAARELVPVVGSRFVEAAAPYWERIPGGNVHDRIRVHPSADRDRDIQNVLTLPVDPATGPPVRLDILRSGSGDTLCITVHHAAMDAHGLIVYAQLLAGFYRNPGAGQGRSLSPSQDRSLTRLLSQFPKGNPVPVITAPAPRHQGWTFPARPGDCTKRAFAIRTLPAERMSAIRSAARIRGATVNDLLLAAFFSALCDYSRPEPATDLPISVSIDLRRYLAMKKSAPAETDPDTNVPVALLPLDTIANLSVAFDVMLPTGSRSFDERIMQASTAMQVHKAHNPGIDAALEIESYGYTNFAGFTERVRLMRDEAAGTGATTPLLGNIGILPEAATAFSPDLPVINAFIAGIVINPPGIALGVTTFRNRMTLSIGYGSADIQHDRMERFMDTLTGYLPGG